MKLKGLHEVKVFLIKLLLCYNLYKYYIKMTRIASIHYLLGNKKESLKRSLH